MISSKRRWRLLLGSLNVLRNEVTAVTCFATLMLLISSFRGSYGYFGYAFGQNFEKHPARLGLGFFYWFGASVVLYMLAPLAFSKLTRGSFHRKYGLGLGDWKTGMWVSSLFIAIMVPAAAIASRAGSFRSMYPLASTGAYVLKTEAGEVTSLGLFVVYELAYCAYFVAWEFLFRGWLLNTVLRAWGRAAAVLVQMVPFALLHSSKPELEAYGSLVAGLALGLLALRTRSFWYGALIHCAVAVAMDIFSASHALFPSP